MSAAIDQRTSKIVRTAAFLNGSVCVCVGQSQAWSVCMRWSVTSMKKQASTLAHHTRMCVKAYTKAPHMHTYTAAHPPPTLHPLPPPPTKHPK